MKNDILKNLLQENRFKVSVKEWKYGGNVERISSDTLPFPAPVIGCNSKSGDFYQSGGRSILPEHGGIAYKLKGIDPAGMITALYWMQKTKELGGDEKRIKSLMDVDDTLYAAYKLGNDECTALKDGKLGMYNEKPFGVLLKKNAQNESEALNLISTGYEDYLPPQIPVAIYEFNNLDFVSEGEPQKAASILTKLPLSIGSDFRLSELNTFVRRRYDSLGEIEKSSKEKAINNLYERIYRWVGYDAKILFDNHLLPNRRSTVSSNFSISYKNANKDIGVSRVDHSSTKIGAKARKYGFFSDSSLFWNSSQIIDCQNPLLLKEKNNVIFALKKIGALRNYKKKFDKGWNGEVEPLNDYIEAVLA